MSVLSQNTEESTGSDLTSLYSMKKLIKNYTTDIPVETTIAEIQKLLAENGARGIALEYDHNGTIKDIFFKIRLHGKDLPFRLPSKPDHVYAAVFANMQYQEKLRQERMKKAEAIAWRICKTWLEAQITLINLEQAKLEEVFLPYLVTPSNKTLFEMMEQRGFLLDSGKEAA
jgi:hypothetical protein